MNVPLADQLYFTLCDPYTGRARLPEGQLATTLAAGLLCELMVAELVRLDGRLLTASDQAATSEPTQLELLRQVREARAQAASGGADGDGATGGAGSAGGVEGRSRRRGSAPQPVIGPGTIADCLAQWRRPAADLITARMTRAGWAGPAPRRRLGLSGTVIVAVDPAAAQASTDRLAAYLRNRIIPAMPEAIVATLVMLSGIRPDPLTPTSASRELLISLVPSMPEQIRQVLARTERVLGGNHLRSVL